ncbi:hypothetical protein C8F01DRAFT_1121120 [Mycena amicta]|nr:hypothetical protein C8F01DRAFT_1121120 [Mycena amicta]
MALLDLTLGCILVASWANMVLFTLQCLQTVKYFTRYPKDVWFNKACVLGALASDTMATTAILAACYLYMVTHWGSQDFIATQPWGIPVYIVGTVVTAAIVQIWLTRMIYNLTKQWFWIPIVGLVILTALVFGGATAAQIFINPSYTGRVALGRYATIWLSASAVADCFITALLVWKFRSIKTSFSDTKDLLRRLTIASLRNGSITTIMTLITLVVYKAQPEANTATMIEMAVGRLYTLSMLANLNSREMRLGDSQTSASSPSGARNKSGLTNGNDQTPTVLRIRQDVETHYQSDADAIPMSNIDQFGRTKRDLESGDGDANSDVDLPVVVTVKQEKHYHNDF